MRTTAFCLLALVAAAFVAEARDLSQATDTSCVSEAASTLVLSGSGSGSAKAESFCEAEAKARSDILSVLSVYYASASEDSSMACTKAGAAEAVTGIAEAVARAYASVSTEVEIVGTGTACAEGFAGGDAFALSVVDIMIDLSVQLIEETFPDQGYEDGVKDVGTKTLASGTAAGKATAVIIADAWAAATASACQEGTGFASDFQVSFAESISEAIASLWANIVVEFCSNFENADTEGLEQWQMETSSSTSQIEGAIDVENSTVDFATETAGSGGTAGETPVCEGAVLDICCAEDTIDEKTCRCGDGCPAQFEVTSRNTGIKTWRSSGGICFCPTT